MKASPEVAALYRAIADITAVGRVARLLIEHDEYGAVVRRGEELGSLRAAIDEALAREAAGGSHPLNEPHVRELIETGLIVTYSRPFTKGAGYPLRLKQLIPRSRRDLHDELLLRRRKRYAHTDYANAPGRLRREVFRFDNVEFADGLRGRLWRTQELEPINVGMLGQIAEHAEELVQALLAELSKAMDRETASD